MTTASAPARLHTTWGPAPEQVRERIAPVLAELRATVARREAERTLPRKEARLLTAAGLTALRLPRSHGGSGAGVRQLAEAVIDVAAADSGLAQALRSTFLTAESVLATSPGPDRELTAQRIVRGDVFAGTRNELDVRPGGTATRVRRTGTGLVLDGRKFYSTGGLYADWLSGTALDEHERTVSFLIPADREGVRLEDDFHGIGQNLSASGSMVFQNVLLEASELSAERAPGLRPQTTLAQLYLAAILSGVTQAAFDDAVRFVRESARPIKHSSAASTASAEDPYVRQRLGTIAAEAQAARATVLLAAEALDAAWAAETGAGPADGGAEDGTSRAPGTADRPAQGDDERSGVPEQTALGPAAVAVAQAQIAAAARALSAAEQVFDLGGGTAVRAEFALDRHWRNARTLANHSPRDWKAAVAGAYHLTGMLPPGNGLF